MPPKNDPPPAAAAAAAPAPAPAAPAAGSSKIAALIPVILVVVLAPAVSWAVAQFVIIPKMEEKLKNAVASSAGAHGEGASAEAAPAAEASHGGGGGEGGHGGGAKKGEASGAANDYEFSNMVVNLAGTMGTRYLKVTFKVVGKDNNLRNLFNDKKAQMVDITLNVLSSLTLADLEEAGAKNIIREKLVNAYNQALGKRVAEQIYFSDFVVQ